MRFTWITDDAGLDSLREEWTLLDAGAGAESVFRSWEWQATWWRVLGKRRRRHLRVLVARDDDGRPRGILPLYVDDAPIAGIIPRRRLRLLGDLTVGSDYLGLVAPRADLPFLAPLFANHVAHDDELRRVDHFELTDLRSSDSLVEDLPEAFDRAGFTDIDVTPRYRCPLAELGDDLEAYLGTRPQKFGSQVRNRRKELAKKPGFSLEILSDPELVVRNLDHLFRLHRQRWEDEGGSDAIPGAAVEEFHRLSGRLLAERGFARLCVLEVEGRPVAAGYGFVRNGRFAYYQAGLDPEWRKRSAGMVVMVELIRHAHAGGAREVDFLRGEEPYKGIWATDVRATVAVHARRATRSARRAARAMELLGRLRERVKSALPEPAVVAVRRLLREKRI